ncbi:MAG: diaminopimelate epimerase [Thermomicrobiales bacterium]
MTEERVRSRIDAPIPFWKMSGSGNDFVVIDNRAGFIAPETAGEFTRLVCRRRVSVGADGVVLIEPSTEDGVHFRWRYLNADGSDGEMCGNGAMCGARFAYLHGIAPAACVFRTESGLVRAAVDTDSASIRIAIDDPSPIRHDVHVTVDNQPLTLHAIQVGVPHAVLIVEDADAFPPSGNFNALGRDVRHHPEFAPAGTNLNVITVRDGRTLRMRTYERGVEDETLARGTGAVAGAVVAIALGRASPPVDVLTSSGQSLSVDFAWNGNRATAVTLGGEARIVMTGEICSEALM